MKTKIFWAFLNFILYNNLFHYQLVIIVFVIYRCNKHYNEVKILGSVKFRGPVLSLTFQYHTSVISHYIKCTSCVFKWLHIYQKNISLLCHFISKVIKLSSAFNVIISITLNYSSYNNTYRVVTVKCIFFKIIPWFTKWITLTAIKISVGSDVVSENYPLRYIFLTSFQW